MDIGYWILDIYIKFWLVLDWIALHCALKTTCAREGGHHFTRGTYIDKIPSLISPKRKKKEKED